MAKRLMVSSGIQFDSINKLKKEAQSILDSVSKQVNLKITNVDISNLDKSIDRINKKISTLSKGKIDIDGLSSAKSLEELAKTLREIQGMSKYKVELMSDGQVRVVTDVNNKLKETVRTVKNLTTGNTDISISGNVDKNKKDVYSEIIQLQRTEYDLKTRLLTADGEYAKVLREQLDYTQQMSKESIKSVNSSNLSDEALYNKLLKERSGLEDKLNLTKSKISTDNFNKTNQELLKQSEYLDKIIARLRIYQQSVNNKGGGKPTEQAELNSEISRQIAKMEELKKQNNLLGTAEKNRINSTVSQMRVQTNELVKYESSFSNLFKRMGMYAFGGSIIYSGIAEIKKGINDIINLNSAMRDLSKVAKATQEQLDNFTSVANNMAKEIGTSTENIIKATEYYSKLGYAIDDASARAREATIFKNVGDFSSIDDASKALITISKGFDLNSLEDMVRIMDVANNTGNKFSSSTKDVADGLQKMGNALYEAGNTYEQAVGLFVAGNASIQDADVVGNALKTIAMRLRGMETEIDDTSIPVSKLRDEIKQLTASAGQMVDIMVDDNTFKSTYQQMTELSQVYPKLTDGQRAYLQYVIAGQRQGNIFSGTMQNMQEGIEAYNSALESSGSSYEEQERFMNSIEGKMNQFSETLKSIWVNAINSDTIKNVVDFGTTSLEVFGKMSNTFGALPTTIGVATTALIVFNKEMYMGMTKNIPIVGGLSLKIDNFAKSTQMSIGRTISGAFNKFAESLTSASAKASVLSAKNTVLAVSFKAVEVASALATATMTLGLSLAITGIITGITKLVDKLVVTKKEMREMNEESTRFVTDSGKAITQAQKLLVEKTNLEQQIANTSDINQRKDLESQLVEIEKELASVLPQSATGFNAQGDAISTNNGLIEEQIRLKKEQMEIEALGFIETNKGLSNELNALEQKKKQYEEMKLAMIKGEEYKKQVAYTERGNTVTSTYSQKVTQSDLDKLNQEIQDTTLKASQAQVHIKWLLDNGYKASQLTQMGFDTNAVSSYINSINKATEATKENTKAKQDNANAQPNTPVSVEEASKTYASVTKEITNMQNALKELGDMQEMSAEMATSLLEKYPQMGASVFNVAEAQEFLNSKIEEQAIEQQKAYEIMIANSENWYQKNIANNDEMANAVRNFAKTFVDEQGNAYDIDVKNYKTLAELKNAMNGDLIDGIANFLKTLVGGSSDAYARDLRNCKTWAEQKALIIAKISAQIDKAESQLRVHLTNIQKVDSSKNSDSLVDEKLYKNTQVELDKLNSAKTQIETTFDEFGAVFDKGISGIHGGSLNSVGTGGSNKDKTEKEIANMEKLSDRYRDVNNALKELDNELDRNKILMENTSDKEKLKYLDKELELIKKQEIAYKNKNKEQQKELSELKNSLVANGFNADGSGRITNANSRLDALTNWANSLSGDAKENAQKNVKAIAESLERYNDLLLNQIPEVSNAILDLKNTTIDTQKEIVEIFKKQKDSYVENIQKETDALKKEIQKRKDLRNKEWDEEDYADELKKRQDTLVDLESQLQDAMRMADGELIANIKKQIESAQQDINNFIRDNERDKANQRYDDELEKIDEDAQKKIDEINSKLTDEEILKMVQNGVRDLSSVLDNIGNANKNIASTFTSVGDIIQNEWLGGLDKFIAELKSVNSLDLNLNANVGRSVANTNANNKSIGDINLEYKLVVEGDMNEGVLPKVEKMIKKAKDETMREIVELARTR